MKYLGNYKSVAVSWTIKMKLLLTLWIQNQAYERKSRKWSRWTKRTFPEKNKQILPTSVLSTWNSLQSLQWQPFNNEWKSINRDVHVTDAGWDCARLGILSKVSFFIVLYGVFLFSFLRCRSIRKHASSHNYKNQSGCNWWKFLDLSFKVSVLGCYPSNFSDHKGSTNSASATKISFSFFSIWLLFFYIYLIHQVFNVILTCSQTDHRWSARSCEEATNRGDPTEERDLQVGRRS